MKTTRLTCFLLLLFPLTAKPQGARFDIWLQDYVKAKRVPSIAAGVYSSDSISWSGAAGKANIEQQTAASVQSLYRVASVSKFITAVAILKLVQDGKIRLDEDARSYIPYFPQKKWKFTVRQLLNHTSGIRTYRNEDEFNSKVKFNSIREAVEYLGNDTLLYEPGTGYTYSSLAYNLLAGIIEQVSGLPYPEFLQQAIFNPAGMAATRVDVQEEIIEGRASGYYRNAQRLLQNAPLADLSVKIPGGGLLSNVTDLLRFSRALLNGRILSTAMLDTMRKETILKNGTKKNYGLGAETGIDKKGRVYFGHGGAGTGFSSYLVFYPVHKTAAVYLVNTRDRVLGNPAMELACAILRDTLQPPKASLADFLLEHYPLWGLQQCLQAADSISSSVSKYYVTENEIRYFADALAALGKRADALAAYLEALKNTPDNRDLLVAAGKAYLADGNKGMALKYLKRARQLYPNDSEITAILNTLEPPATKEKARKSK